MTTVYFDMDGTIYDLYGVRGWLDRLHAEDETAYSEGGTLVDMQELCDMLARAGVRVGVITWTAKGGRKEYNAAVRRVKRAWVAKHLPCVAEFHCVKYGTPKHWVAKDKNAILVDDNAAVRAAWKGQTVDASNPQKTLMNLRNTLDALVRNVV